MSWIMDINSNLIANPLALEQRKVISGLLAIVNSDYNRLNKFENDIRLNIFSDIRDT